MSEVLSVSRLAPASNECRRLFLPGSIDSAGLCADESVLATKQSETNGSGGTRLQDNPRSLPVETEAGCQRKVLYSIMHNSWDDATWTSQQQDKLERIIHEKNFSSSSDCRFVT